MVKLSENTLVTVKLSLLIVIAGGIITMTWTARGYVERDKINNESLRASIAALGEHQKKMEAAFHAAADFRWRSFEETYKTAEDIRRMNTLFKEHFPDQYAKMKKDPVTGQVEMFIRPDEVKRFFLQLEKNENGN